jgi:hypothetical protein
MTFLLHYLSIGPYDERLPGMSSVINWFYISQSPQERGHPKRLLYDLIEDSELPEEEATSWVSPCVTFWWINNSPYGLMLRDVLSSVLVLIQPEPCSC